MHNILCVCLRGENRSKYLALYLNKRGYETSYGGVAKDSEKVLTQYDIDKADMIIVVREYIRKLMEEKFLITGKKIIQLEVSDYAPELGENAIKVHKRSKEEFQNRFVRPKLRSQINQHLN